MAVVWASATPALSQTPGLSTQNDVFVLEGNPRYVSVQAGQTGISEDNKQALVGDVTEDIEVGESFDVMVVFTAFDDRANDDSGIDFQLIHNTVQGIGLQSMDNDFREDFGLSPNARVSAVIYVNPWTYLGLDFDSNPSLTSQQLAPLLEETFQKDLARAIGRRWLFRAAFREGMALSFSLRNGNSDSDFLWSNIADSGGSLMGGKDFEEVGDGQFEFVGENERFVPLDRYLMGMLSANEVAETELYYIQGATFEGGMVLPGGAFPVPLGGILSGTKVPVTIDQIIAGMGPRVPSASSDLARPFKRFVFGVLTRDEFQGASEFGDLRAAVEDLRIAFADTWQELAGIQACTAIEDLRNTCPEPQLRLEAFSVQGPGGNAIAPGDTVDLDLLITNTGSGPAAGARAEFDPGDTLLELSPSAVDLPTVDEGDLVQLPNPVQLTVNATTCGTPIPLGVTLRLSEGPVVSNTLSIPVGTEQLRFDPLDEAPNWRVDPEGTDTADDGTWALAVPSEVRSLGGTITQPDEDHTPEDASDLAFITGPRSDGLFSRSDLDGGRTTLQTPVIAIGEARAPLMRVWLWRTATDFTVNPPEELDNPLVIEASTDGGETWTVIEEFREQTETWTLLEVDLRSAGIEPSNRTLFRFWIEENESTENIEAGVDDFEVIDFLPGCPQVPDDVGPDPDPDEEEEEGGGCTQGGAARSSRVLLAIGLAAWWVRRRRTAT